jgi:hypothetical protein
VTHPRRSTRLRPALRAAWLAPLALAGFLLAADPRHAQADLLPTLPTVTTPLGTISVPTASVPTVTTVPATTATTAPVTTATSTTTAVTTTVVAHTTTTTASPASPATTTVVASTPARLVVRLSLSARNLPDSKHRITARVRVADTRGHLVRGARVSVRSVPSGLLRKIAAKASAKNGAASFLIQLRAGKPSRGSLTLVVTAVDPTAPTAAAASVHAKVTLRPAVK